jgi:hypothetical protein
MTHAMPHLTRHKMSRPARRVTGGSLASERPEVRGGSRGGLGCTRILKYMRAFAEAWPDEEIVRQAVARLPWGHNARLLDPIKSREERLWYAPETPLFRRHRPQGGRLQTRVCWKDELLLVHLVTLARTGGNNLGVESNGAMAYIGVGTCVTLRS